jgi:hypothetical protein
VSFLSMIKNTSTILKEKYSERLKNDINESSPESHMIKNNEPKRSILDGNDNEDIDGLMFTETIKIFSDRYQKVPKKKVINHFNTEEEDEEDSAISSKQRNLSKLNNPVKMVTFVNFKSLGRKSNK